MYELKMCPAVVDYYRNDDTRVNALKECESELIRCGQNLSESYLKMGTIFLKIYEENLFVPCRRVNGEYVATFADYVKSRWGINKTAVSTMMGIVKNFCDENGVLLPEFQGYGYSQLCELLPLYIPSLALPSVRVIGTFPAWVNEEIEPGMSVAQIREKKKQHKAKEKVANQIKRLPTSETLSDLKAPVKMEKKDDGTEAVVKDVSGEDVSLLVFKNNDARRYFLQNYWAWQVYYFDPFLGLTWYRALMNDGTWIIAVAWGNGKNFSFSRKYYLKRPGKNFCLFDEAEGTIVNLICSEKLSLVLDSVESKWRDRIGEKLERPIEE